jgi:hypothetical protein
VAIGLPAERRKSVGDLRVRRTRAAFARALALLLGGAAEPCLALNPDFQDKAAHVLALFIIIAVPIGGIVLFWLVHVLPEKLAEKRHHPQKEAIHVLCLLSLFFGGLLWPLAWLWVYTKPVLHKVAYGRDKHDDYYDALARAEGATAELASVEDTLERLRRDLDRLEQRGERPEAVAEVRERLARLANRETPAGPAGG